jgi:hypothetical protein
VEKVEEDGDEEASGEEDGQDGGPGALPRRR